MKKEIEYRVQVNTHGDPHDSWSGNAMTYESAEKAREAAHDLFLRWTAVKDYRVIDSNDKVHYCTREG